MVKIGSHVGDPRCGHHNIRSKNVHSSITKATCITPASSSMDICISLLDTSSSPRPGFATFSQRGSRTCTNWWGIWSLPSAVDAIIQGPSSNKEDPKTLPSSSSSSGEAAKFILIHRASDPICVTTPSANFLAQHPSGSLGLYPPNESG